MTSSNDQYSRWAAALKGERLVWERGDIPSGFFRQGTSKGIEAIAIWRDEAGQVQCKRSIFGDGSKLTTADEIGEELSGALRYPIPYDLYVAVTQRGEEWPPEYSTRLTMEEIKAGVVWTPELGRKKLGLASAGGNSEALVAIDLTAPTEPDKQLQAKIETVDKLAQDFLTEIGGSPRTKDEADKLADFATKMGGFSTDAVARHKVEKEPHLAAGRAVDAKWFGLCDAAANFRKAYLRLVDKWTDAEKAKRAEAARLATIEAQRLADLEAKATGDVPAEVEAVRAEPVKVGNLRTVSQKTRRIWIVKDRAAFAAYLCGLENPEFDEVLAKLANKLGTAGVKAPGIAEETRSASS